ncbi:MAG: DUF4910 domain-containing protein [Acidobacteriota bacterium]|nr:DUF4910 domain-containing protein [Acidobacteriota bacterium]
MKKAKILSLAISILIALTVQLEARNHDPVLSEKDLRALNNEISGERTLDAIRHMAHFHRLQPGRDYLQAAEWVAEQAKKSGLSDVRIERYPADGDISYSMTRSSPAWDVRFAELWITRPKEEKLTSFHDIPVSLAIMSRSCDVEGELIFVGAGTSRSDYENRSVKGNVVLATGPMGSVTSLAVDGYGALGVVVINQRFAHDEPDAVSTTRIRDETPAFGFGLSRRRGEELRDRLLRGEKIFVRAVVETEIGPGHYENVVAVIPGTELAGEEILLTAHLCHYKPGANDNASGSACLLEIGRALVRLIEDGKIKRPKRTLRFLWVPEFSGSIAFAVKHPDIIERTVAGINLDMVGQYLNDNNSTFFLHLTPHSRPHYINDLLINLVEFVTANNMESLGTESRFPVLSLTGSRDAFRSRVMGYTGGSDQHIFNDGLIAVPMPFFNAWPDRYYHASGDQPEICDPTQLKRSGVLAAAAVVFLMDDCPHKARRLAGEISAVSRSRIALELKRGLAWINRAGKEDLHDAYKEALNFIDQAYKRETASLLTLKDYSRREGNPAGYIDQLAETLSREKAGTRERLKDHYLFTCQIIAVTPQDMSPSEDEIRAAGIIPRRNREWIGPAGTGFLREKTGAPDSAFNLPLFRENRLIPYEILNFIDGKNSLIDIRNAVSAEFQPIPLKWVEDYIDLLVRAELVFWNAENLSSHI